MTEAPMRIWAWIYADPWGNELRWFEWENHTPEADEAEYILTTEHDRIVAEKDAEIARLREALLEIEGGASPDHWVPQFQHCVDVARAALGDDNG